MSDDIAIRVHNVSKSFKLPHEKHGSIKSLFVNGLKAKRTYEKQEVLKNISFDIKKGEFFGIVGRNGSGKSTLLKLMAGIYTPNKGNIQVNGKLTPFIELGVGFNPNLSGRENVFLNGALLGFSRDEMEVMYDDIVEFAELERFMDQKLKNYSSGMQVRLAFSIAIRAQGDILLLDEVLAVGDAAFQQKCFDYFQSLKDSNTTVILVSHDRASLERFCTNGILISDGKLLETGNIKSVLSSYSNVILSQLEAAKGMHKGHGERFASTEYASINSVFTYNVDGKKQTKFKPGEIIHVSFNVKINKKLTNPVFGINVWLKGFEKPVFAHNTNIEDKETGDFQSNSQVHVKIELPNSLNNGIYYVEPAVVNQSATFIYSQIPEATTFYIGGSPNPYSVIYQEKQITLSKK